MPTARTQARRSAVAELLRAARAELTEHGWTQHDLVSGSGALDVVGALRRAAGCHPHEEPSDPTALHTLWDAQAELARALADDPATTLDADQALEALARWNDHPHRTRAHVLDQLAETADDLDRTALAERAA